MAQTKEVSQIQTKRQPNRPKYFFKEARALVMMITINYKNLVRSCACGCMWTPAHQCPDRHVAPQALGLTLVHYILYLIRISDSYICFISSSLPLQLYCPDHQTKPLGCYGHRLTNMSVCRSTPCAYLATNVLQLFKETGRGPIISPFSLNWFYKHACHTLAGVLSLLN